MAQEPVQREFFTFESMGGLTRALVRESVQNALDARVEGSNNPVLVRFTLVEIQPQVYRAFLDGLLPHLATIQERYVTQPDVEKPMKALLVEDFNTSGLDGQTDLPFLKDANPKENFYYFWRNVGRTGKSGASLGSWGLGKTVFPAVSKIATFFGLTCRKSDQRQLLMGHSVLRYHELQAGQPLTPYGYYGMFMPDAPHFSLPIEDPHAVDLFRRGFHITRQAGETGLSIVIPFPYEDIVVRRLLLQAILEYFYPILIGDLIIEIGEMRSGQLHKGAVKGNNLDTIVEKQFTDNEFEEWTSYGKAAFLRLISFMRWALANDESSPILINPPNNNTPDWKNYALDTVAEKAREQLERHQRVSFTVSVPVKLNKQARSNAQMGGFKVYIERDEHLHGAETYFLRSGIWVKEVKGHNLRGIRAIVVIDGVENPLVHLLASAENPAHTEWQEQSNALKQYVGGPQTLRFVRQSVSRLGGLLTERDKKIDQDLLKDVFFIEQAVDEAPHRAKTATAKTAKEGTGLGDFPDLPSREPSVVMQPMKDGVQINGGADAPLHSEIQVEFAYAVRRGNAFQKYEVLDFDLANMTVESQCVEVKVQSQNILRFVVTQAPFTVRVRGFDILRDVETRLKQSRQES
jgi:hypothetical protein